MEDKKVKLVQLTEQELKSFNDGLMELMKKHNTTLVANPFIEDGKIKASLVAMKMEELIETPYGEATGTISEEEGKVN